MSLAMTVSDAARMLGCTPEAVRSMEKRGVLVCIRTVGGYRLFDQDDVQKLKMIRDARPTKWHPIGGAS